MTTWPQALSTSRARTPTPIGPRTPPRPLSAEVKAQLPAWHKPLVWLADAGSGYRTRGPRLTTLSGGERQRSKRATRMGEKGDVYVLD